MLHHEKPQPVPRLPLPMVVLIAAGAFLFGHYATHHPPPATAAPHRHPAAAPAATGSSGARSSTNAAHLREMGELGQEFLRASGLLQLRPPLRPAASGNEFYTVQPYQILSWYPR